MHWWPAFSRRRTMLAPIRPRPIIPSCTSKPSLKRLAGPALMLRLRPCGSLQPAVTPDQRVGGAIVCKLRLRHALQLRNDALRERLSEFDAPLVEGIDLPDRSLREHVVLV